MRGNRKTSKWIIGLLIILILIVLVGIVPYAINKLLYLPIMTNGTTDSDWLSFWGSFLGGIIGGIGTLIGVLLTLNKGSKDKEEDKKKEIEERKPRLIPIKKQFYLVYTNSRIIVLNNSEEIFENYSTSMHPEIRIVNASKESAIDIELEWIKPDEESIIKCESLNVEEKYIFNNFSGKYELSNRLINEFEFISSLGEESMSVHTYLMIYIEKISEYLLKYCIDNGRKIFIKHDLPMGELILRCKNVYGEEAKNSYKISMSLFSTGTDCKNLMGILTFIKDENK